MNSITRRINLRSLTKCHQSVQTKSMRNKNTAQNTAEENVVTSVYNDIIIPNCSINDYMWQNLDRWPDKTAVVCGITGHGYTFSQMYRVSVSFAASLRTKLKLQTDDFVAIALPNIPEYPCVALGILQAGCVVTTINPVYTSFEIKKQLEAVNCKAIVTCNACYPAILEALKQLKQNIPIIITDMERPEGTISYAEFAEDFSVNTDCLKSVYRKNGDLAFVPFSSGTTGLPKGVQLTHRNIIAANQQVVDDAIVSIEPTTETHQDVFPAVLPFYHIFGLVVVMLNQLLLGCKLVTLPTFHPETFLKILIQHKPSAMFCVPPIAMFLGKHPAVKAEHLQSMRSIVCGAAPLSAEDVQILLKKKDNMIIRQGYGLTETGAVATIGKNSEMNYASVGFPVAKCEVKIADVETGKTLGPRQDGELWVRGPQIMKGYLNEEANKEVFTEDGWFKTGDVAQYHEDKYIYITDRMKELIKVKGFQVPPAELEAILRSHPKILDCAVVGTPDPISGEVPKAFVVLQDNQQASEDEVKDFLNGKVVQYKRLGSVQFVDSIPKNASGKILRKQIKEKYC